MIFSFLRVDPDLPKQMSSMISAVISRRNPGAAPKANLRPIIAIFETRGTPAWTIVDAIRRRGVGTSRYASVHAPQFIFQVAGPELVSRPDADANQQKTEDENALSECHN